MKILISSILTMLMIFGLASQAVASEVSYVTVPIASKCKGEDTLMRVRVGNRTDHVIKFMYRYKVEGNGVTRSGTDGIFLSPHEHRRIRVRLYPDSVGRLNVWFGFDTHRPVSLDLTRHALFC